MTRLPALRLYYGLEFFLSMPTWIVISVYIVRGLHLSPLQLVLMGTAMEAAVFAFEVPTGVVADTYSRRLSLVIGFVGMGLAWMLVGIVSSPLLVIVLWAIWGISYTFTSGAYQAWLADEVGVDALGPALLRGARIGFAGSLVGLVALVGLSIVSLRVSVIAGGAITLACGVVAAFAMPETGFSRRPRSERAAPWAELAATAAAGARFVRARTLILLLIASEVFAGMSSEAYDRLRDAHVLRDIGLPSRISLAPAVWFGIVAAVAMLFGFAAVGVLLRRVERRGTREVARALVALLAVVFVAELLFARVGAFGLALAAMLVVSLARSLLGPVYMIWLNQQITDSSVRATVISISGQADAIGQAAGGPALGAIGNAWGIRAALTAGALVLLPALGFYGRALGHDGREPELEALPAPSPVAG
ncbi:MAG: MFS transporter [Actinomycetota bacterium]|nr:MFS transporter [Actinomycetota bacterium]